MNPYNSPINQGRPYNPDFNNQNGNLRNFNTMGNIPNPSPNNFYPPNPNFVQPMPQNNPLGVIQMLASQIQSNPQLQLNLLNQLQSQNFGAAFNQGAVPFMGPPNHMLGMQNGQILRQNQMHQGNQMLQGNQMHQANQMLQGNQMHQANQMLQGNQIQMHQGNQMLQGNQMHQRNQMHQGNQMLQGNQMHQGNQMRQGNQMIGSPGFGSGPVTMGQNQGIQNTNAAAKQVKHDDNRTTETPRSFYKQRSNNRFQKSQTFDKRHLKGDMKQFKRRGGRGGKHNLGVRKPISMDFSEKDLTTPKRSLNYTTTDIQLWLQARKKNFPTKANIDKKKASENKNIEDADAKLRRQQLKEVLQKQAELGVEVAEIPRKYLEEEPKENEADEKNDVSCKKSYSRGGRRGNPEFRKRKPDNRAKGVANSTREPSLLEKLLSADIKRDKLRLLQVIRFMVSNNFFKKSPETPLVFPTVVLKESTLVDDVKLNEEDIDDEVANQNAQE